MRTEAILNWLTPRVLTERFQKRHLIINYSLMAVTLLLYGLGLVGVWAITTACLPGAACFLISLECLAWRMHNDGAMESFLILLGNMR